MHITKHAKVRMRQRGFSNFSIEIIQRYGREEKAPGGAMRIFLGRKECQKIVSELKQIIQELDKSKNGNLVLYNGLLLTLYKSN